MRNESCRKLVERVNAPQEEPFIFQIDIDGLNIHASVKQLIINCYEAKQPFGLRADEGGNTVYFFPSHVCAFRCDYGHLTMGVFRNEREFQDYIKLALVAHRKFIPVRQLEGEERYMEICEQLKQIG